jgi:hypothetical protein
VFQCGLQSVANTVQAQLGHNHTDHWVIDFDLEIELIEEK